MGDYSRPDGYIRILGARQNNLKDIDVAIPINRLTVITGVSGSGKSSLAFDTLYAEGQRRYVESLSAYARQFLERINKPQVREVTGISPPVAIRQKNSSRNPRSTVGTVTEIYDFLRLLYARVGVIRCRNCRREVKKDTVDEAVEQLLALDRGTRLFVTFPFKSSRLDLNSDNPGNPIALKLILENLIKQGFQRLLEGVPPESRVRLLPQDCPRSLEELENSRVLLDRLVIRPDAADRLTDSLEFSYREGNGVCDVLVLDPEEGPARLLRFSERFECQHCKIAYRRPEPRLFSFNNPYGACPSCQGFGNTMTLDRELIIPQPGKSIGEGPIDPFTKPRYRRFQRKLERWASQQNIPPDTPYEQLSAAIRRKIWNGDGAFPGVKGFFAYLEKKKYKMHVRIFISRYRGYTRCPECEGERLCQDARDVFLDGRRMTGLTTSPISEIQDFFSRIRLTSAQEAVADKLLREIHQRLDFLVKVGLEYLTLDRLTSTLSGGEMQRIHLAASLSSSLVGALYVLDEPSIGLHARDESRLIDILKNLRDLGNTIVVVEHEKEMIQAADHVIDLGPGPGEHGGEVIESGPVQVLQRNPKSLTGRYLSGKAKVPTPVFRRSGNDHQLTLRGARQHNLQNLTLRIPLGVLVCVSGVSGSGKSTLVHDVLYAGLKKLRGEWKGEVGEFEEIEGWERLSDVLLVDQTPIGRTPRSNPVTYIKAFDEIRKIMASVREARAHNFSASDFSFNVAGGRCETCQGSGTVTVEMQFLADVELLCEDCGGSRYGSRILQVTYRGRNIAEILQMTVQEALEFFRNHRPLARKLRVLEQVGLGYLRLGQSATTLSGGEAQRIKLAAYLSRKTSASPLFIFDEPTTGLHFDDIGKLLHALDHLISRGASIIVIEHNLDVIKCADWIIDLGPDGGAQGGKVVAEGPPETVARASDSHTGRHLRPYLGLQAMTA